MRRPHGSRAPRTPRAYRATTPALLSRILRDDRRIGVVVLLVVIVTAALLAALPRAVHTLADDIVADRMARTTPLVSDLTARPTEIAVGPARPGTTSTVPAEWETTFGLLDGALQQTRSALPRPMAQIVGAGRFRLATGGLSVPPVPGHDVRFPEIELVADPHIAEYTTLTAGRWALAQDWSTADAAPRPAIEIVLEESSADRLAWGMGETRETWPETLVLVGTYVTDDTGDGYWTHSPAAAGPRIIDDPDLGLTVVAAGYVGPGKDPMRTLAPKLSLWFPVEATTLRATDIDQVVSQLRAFTAQRQDAGVPATFSTELVGVVETVQRDVAATTAIVALVASGPIAVLVMLLVAAVRMIHDRRRPAIALARARGASGVQIRFVLAGEGAVLGLLGAGVGAAVAVGVLPGPTTAAVLLGPALVAVVPAVVLAASGLPAGLRTERPGHVRSRLRWVWEVLVVAAAVLATVQLLRRGVAGAGGLDPMLVTAPALVGVAVAVLVARGAPALLVVVVRMAAAGRGAFAFLGSASAQRDGRGRLPAAIGLVVAVTVAVLSTVLLTTVRSGLETDAWTTVGADLRLTGPHVDDATLAQVRAIDGVVAATTVTDVTPAAVTTADGRSPAQVLLVDSVDLSLVQEAVPGWTVPTGLGAPDPAGLRAVVSDGVDASPGPVTLSVDAHTLELAVTGTAATVPGASRGTRWVMLERAAVAEATGASYRPRILLVRLDEAADAALRDAVADQVVALTGPGALELRTEAVATRLTDPTLRGLQTTVLIALITALGLGAATVAASEAAAQPRRERLFAVLEILGMPRRRGQVVSVWEVASWTLPSILGGLGLGLALPVLVHRVVDLRAFTGGSAEVALVYPPGWVALVLGVFVLVVAGCGLASAAVGRTVSSAALLRSVQE